MLIKNVKDYICFCVKAKLEPNFKFFYTCRRLYQYDEDDFFYFSFNCSQAFFRIERN